MDKKEELKGLLKETTQEVFGAEIDGLKEEGELRKEENAKILEENKELKAQMDTLQNKQLTLVQNTGVNKYIFKGCDPQRMHRNFQPVVNQDIRDKFASDMLDMLKESASTGSSISKALTSTGENATATDYGSALLGLGELTSVALANCNVVQASAPIIKLPNKTTRSTIDTQAFGTTNAAAATDLGQTTWTIDKRIGAYETLYNDILDDQIFDVVGQFVEPMIAEGIGQDVDDKVFNGTGSEFTTSLISTATSAVTASGTVAIAAAATFANLITMKNTVEFERGLGQCAWYFTRSMLGDVEALTDTYGRPIYNPVPIAIGTGNGINGTLLGFPIHITPKIDDTPGDGALRAVFGDLSYYWIFLRGGMVFQVNPYVGLKEGYTQFIGFLRADGNLTAAGAASRMTRVDS